MYSAGVVYDRGAEHGYTRLGSVWLGSETQAEAQAGIDYHIQY